MTAILLAVPDEVTAYNEDGAAISGTLITKLGVAAGTGKPLVLLAAVSGGGRPLAILVALSTAGHGDWSVPGPQFTRPNQRLRLCAQSLLSTGEVVLGGAAVTGQLRPPQMPQRIGSWAVNVPRADTCSAG